MKIIKNFLKKDESEVDVLEKELESISEKLKEISREYEVAYNYMESVATQSSILEVNLMKTKINELVISAKEVTKEISELKLKKGIQESIENKKLDNKTDKTKSKDKKTKKSYDIWAEMKESEYK